jgi:crossover junction endodeoxyribonuclease RuvC
MVILGIDPGSRCTGYGVLTYQQGNIHYLASGCIVLRTKTQQSPLPDLFEGLQQLIQQYQPQAAAVEQVFFARNPHSALVLGQTRGVVLLALNLAAIPVQDYAARQIKQAVVGYGAASKVQVQKMMQSLLKLRTTPNADAADALAVAWCHAQSQSFLGTSLDLRLLKKEYK